MSKSLFNMNLHERKSIDKTLCIFRVCGGWIYEYYEYDYNKNESTLISTVFIPLDNEFENKKLTEQVSELIEEL